MSSAVDVGAVKQLLAKLIAAANSVRASDVHLRAEATPYVRIDGALTRANAPLLSARDVEQLIAVASVRPLETFPARDWEFSFDNGQGARFRGHAFRENGRWALSLRVVPATIPTFQELRLPPVCKPLSERGPGLVLITGPTGSGKTTTAAAMLRQLCTSTVAHVVTIEDPIEFRLSDGSSCVSQKEVGRDTPSYSDGLRAAMREDPDMLFIGEIRDKESLEVSMLAAESGVGVMATFHTGTVVQTIQRLVAMFSPEEQVGTRERLAESLRGVICQRLLPRKKQRGRVLATEVMVGNYSLRECIRDPARLKGLTQVLERSNDKLMHSMDQDLVGLVRENLVDVEVAIGAASSPNDLRRTLNLTGMTGT